MMVYPEEPSIWAIPHIPALYDDDGDYGGKHTIKLSPKPRYCQRTEALAALISRPSATPIHSNLIRMNEVDRQWR